MCVFFLVIHFYQYTEKVTGIGPIGLSIQVPIRMRAWQKFD